MVVVMFLAMCMAMIGIVIMLVKGFVLVLMDGKLVYAISIDGAPARPHWEGPVRGTIAIDARGGADLELEIRRRVDGRPLCVGRWGVL